MLPLWRVRGKKTPRLLALASYFVKHSQRPLQYFIPSVGDSSYLKLGTYSNFTIDCCTAAFSIDTEHRIGFAPEYRSTYKHTVRIHMPRQHLKQVFVVGSPSFAASTTSALGSSANGIRREYNKTKVLGVCFIAFKQRSPPKQPDRRVST